MKICYLHEGKWIETPLKEGETLRIGTYLDRNPTPDTTLTITEIP